MNDILIALLVTAAPAPAEEAGQPPLCNPGLPSSVQLAYKPHGNPVFGSDGLTCASVKAGAEARGRTAPPPKGRVQLSRRPARTFNNSVETGP